MSLSSPRLKSPSSKITPLRTGPIPQASPYLEWGPRTSSLAPNRMGPVSVSLIQATRNFPKNGDPIPIPCHPPPRTRHPPLPQLLLPRPPNLICLPVGGHSLLKSPDFGPRISGTAGGEGGRLFKASSPQIRSGRWRWAASLLGSLSGSGGAGAYPQLSPGSGRVRPAGSGLTWAARGPLLKSWDLTRRSAAPREPRLCAHRHPPPSCSG